MEASHISIVCFRTSSEDAPRILDAMTAVENIAAQQVGFLSAEIFSGTAHERVLSISRWSSKEAYEAFLSLPAVEKLTRPLRELVDRERAQLDWSSYELSKQFEPQVQLRADGLI